MGVGGHRLKPRARRAAWILLCASAALGAAAWLAVRPDRAIRVATGFTSHTLCSATFASGLGPEQVYAETVEPMSRIWLIDWALRYEIDRPRRQVRARVAGGFENRAVYRDGVGCLVVHGAEPPAVAWPESGDAEGQAVASPAQAMAAPAVVEPADARLRAALDRAFAEPTRPPYRRIKAVVVERDGQIVAERYAPGYGVETPVLGWSATESVLNALVGILVRQGRLTVEQPAPVPAWRDPRDPRHAITIDELLRMTSGLALEETNSGFDPVTRMLYLERDLAAFAERAHLEAAPGSTWRYTSGNYQILSRILRDAVGGHAEDVLRFAWRELFGPLGMRHVTLEFDSTGTPLGAAYLFASARDWARFGQLYLEDGAVNGRRILPEGWVSYSASPTPAARGGYGAGFWTNRGANEGAARRTRLGLPADSFFASGLLGQYVVVVPSSRLVIARFGVTHRRPGFDIEGLSRLVADVTAVQSTTRQ